MNFKKIGLVVLAVLLAVSLIGCSKVEELVKGVGDVVSPAGETLYNALSMVIGDPESSFYENITGTITFTAQISGEPFEIELEDKDGKFVDTKFVPAVISRKYDDYFLINISDIEYPFVQDDIVTLTGHLDGSIYWTEENVQVDKLAFVASSVVPFAGEAVEPINSPTVSVADEARTGEITFEEAVFTTSTFSDAYAVYFNFKNTGTTDTVPLLGSLEFYQGDVPLSANNFSVDLELKSNALKAEVFGTKTYVGKTEYYYYLLTPFENIELDPTLPLEVYKYDDDFNLIYYWQFESATTVDTAE